VIRETPFEERLRMADRARVRAMSFDRVAVFDDLFPDTDHQRVIATVPVG
jgi:hypothetical protein